MLPDHQFFFGGGALLGKDTTVFDRLDLETSVCPACLFRKERGEGLCEENGSPRRSLDDPLETDGTHRSTCEAPSGRARWLASRPTSWNPPQQYWLSHAWLQGSPAGSWKLRQGRQKTLTPAKNMSKTRNKCREL